ncbi:hypothetical protein [Phenylobacterium sp.]|uniref:hypothetical protein n=1 Tax=Phenylobacterium sp. TaxID=1871053 RepID=UPI002FC82F5D
MKRAYTVTEINRLRQVVEHKWLWGSYKHPQDGGTCQSRCYQETEKAGAVEEMVRTHMLAGHTAENLYASEADA